MSINVYPCPLIPPSSMLAHKQSRTMRLRVHHVGPPTRKESSIATLSHVPSNASASTLNLRRMGRVGRCMPQADVGVGVCFAVALNIPSTVAVALPWLGLGFALAWPWHVPGLALAFPWLGLGLALALPWPLPWPCLGLTLALAWRWLCLGTGFGLALALPCLCHRVRATGENSPSSDQTTEGFSCGG